MNSLEFIEREIKRLKEILKGIDKRIQIDQNHPASLAYDIEGKEHFEKELAHFEQIKSEVEAWKICKKYSHINNYNSNNKRFDIAIWLNTENCDFKGCASFEECLTVKKALEVQDEKNI